MEGVKYYFMPDFSKFSVMTVLGALGQLFYSMSIAMGIMITYGSYMPKEAHIEKSVHQIELFDTGIAMVAGLMIVPAVFAFSGGDQSALGQGPGLMFVTLPKVFETMPGGDIIGAVFFIMVFFAALTSSISLMETVVSIISDKFKLGRNRCCFIVLVFSIVLGMVSALGFSVWSEIKILGMQFLDLFDFISNSIMMPIVAFFTCIVVGYILKPKAIVEEVELLDANGKPYHKFKSKLLFSIVIRYAAPVCILAILISSVLNAFGIISI
jgi:NSS family neurotransmitter:Na+ symporter